MSEPAHTEGIVPTLSELLKLEYLVASTGFSLLPKQPVHSILSGKHASKLRGRGLDFEEARKYVAGDDIRNIDWRVTARTRQTYTKVYTEEKEKPALAITDMTPGMFFGSQLYTKSYMAAQMAAITAFKILKNGDRFGGLVFNEQDFHVIAPQRSRKAVLQYLKKVVNEAEMLAQGNRTIIPKASILEKALLRSRSMVSHDYLIIVISDFHDMTPKSIKHLIQMSRHNDIILVHISDPMEEKLPEEKMVLSDGDLQLLWESGKKQAGKKYEDGYLEDSRHFFKDMEKHGIPFMPISTAIDLEIQLKSLFKSKLKTRRI